MVVTSFIIIQSPVKVVIHNGLYDKSLVLKNKGLIETLITPIDHLEEAQDRVKTPFSNTLTIYKGVIPIKKVQFAMPSMFENDDSGQIIMKGNVYQIDRTFYDVLTKIGKEKRFTFDTM